MPSPGVRDAAGRAYLKVRVAAATVDGPTKPESTRKGSAMVATAGGAGVEGKSDECASNAQCRAHRTYEARHTAIARSLRDSLSLFPGEGRQGAEIALKFRADVHVERGEVEQLEQRG
jgi:hypothetical protein